MKRGYTVEEYRKLIHRIRERVPGGMIATDIIVGFPGETKEQFMHTYDLLEELRFDVAHLARYSPRPHTVSKRQMPDDVSENEKMDRFRALEELQSKVAAELNMEYNGKVVEVLVEGMNHNRWKGRTRTNKLVFFESSENMLGELVPVEIHWTGPWSMRGHLPRTELPIPATPEPIHNTK
jgi:tRNA-2-methylthio-N6-dimethylallyladenosine synthase